MTDLKKRYEFAVVFDVKDGNPNGDPDAGNLPRIDPESLHGIVTDVCLKRKIRNFIHMTKAQETGFDIFVKEHSILNCMIDDGYKAAGLNPEKAKDKESKAKKDRSPERRKEILTARERMCKDYYDIRTFGAVLSTGANAGQVRGPVQMTFARSIDPIFTQEHTLTRVAVTSEKDAKTKLTEMGRKNTIPYGLYVTHGFVSAHLAAQTGFSTEDLELLWDALKIMFEHDRSAARGLMSTRKLIVFEHDSALGNAPAHTLFDRLTIQRKDDSKPPRAYADYTVDIHRNELPSGITIHEMI